ncbi:hypothetical protein F2Q68_00042474 [Brassica cretica]|uniref:Uncharacterized protein n=1 Tax=Brassica cretica TaxID=69181 RepID=A0A8S9MJB6_BRACR|nr:hypothetical protein F2Q68_00042474 [Brassica cretica]
MYTDVAKHYLHDPWKRAGCVDTLRIQWKLSQLSLDTLLQRLSLDMEKATLKDNLLKLNVISAKQIIEFVIGGQDIHKPYLDLREPFATSCKLFFAHHLLQRC